MRTLIVEDNTEKLGKIVSALAKVVGVHVEDVDDCRDANGAKRLLRDRKYDLLVIDIAIPERVTDGVLEDGGIRLLEEITGSDLYVVPDHIIGMTAYEQLQASAQKVFSEYDWSVIQYRAESEEWEEKLKKKAAHILAALKTSSAARGVEYESDLAIVCALRSPELAAVRDHLPWAWKQYRVASDHSVYYRGEFQRDGQSRLVYACASPRVGMSAAAVLATKMVYSFRPRFLVMTGIAAGIRDSVHLGDVIVADECWDYGSGKILQQEERTHLRIAPHQLCLGPDIRAKVQLLAEEADWLQEVQSRWTGVQPVDALKMRIGPVASGAAVLASTQAVQMVVQQHRKLLAIEMEAYGVLSAAEEAPSPRPSALIIKSVSDFADELKNDSMQLYAAYTSACVVRRFAETFI